MHRTAYGVELFSQRSSRRPSKIPGGAARDLLQNLLRKHAAAMEFDSRLHQLKQNVLTFLTNGSQVLHIDNESGRRAICPRDFAYGSELRCPRADELAFHD